MKTKRLLRLTNLLVVFMFVFGNALSGVSLVFAQTGSAAAGMNLSAETRAVGDILTVDIYIDVSGVASPDHKLGSYTGTLSWDPGVYEYQSYADAPPAGFTGVVNDTDAATGQLVFNGANAMGAEGSLVIISVTFEAVGSGPGNLDLEFSAMAAATTFNSLLPILTVQDRSVEVEDLIPGTVELDGDVTTASIESASSMNFSHTTGAEENRLMLVGVSWNSYNTATAITSVTFTPDGGSADPLDLVITQKQVANERYSAIYSLLDPPASQAGTIDINFSATVGYGIIAGAANFSGVDQADPLGTAVGASSPDGGNNTTVTVGLSSLNGDELVFDNVFLGGNPPADLAVDAGQTQLGDWNLVEGNSRGAASIEQADSDSVTMSWTAASDSMWVTAAVPINPAMVEPPTCYTLTLNSGPNGGDPTADPANSWGCDPGTYSEGEGIDLTAYPDPSYQVGAWSGTDDDGSTALTNHLTMTASAAVVSITYEPEPIIPEVVLDGTVSSSADDDVSSISFAHTTGTGLNRLLLVGASWNSNSDAVTISSATFTPDGDAAISLDPVISQKHGSNERYAAIYSLLDPPAGLSGTVTVNFTGTISAGVVAGAANFAGVDQAEPLGTAVGASSSSNGTTVTVDVPSLDGDELVFDTIFVGGNPPATTTPDAGQTQLGDWNKDEANARGAASIEQADSDTVTMSWTAASSSMWVTAAVAINPAPAPEIYNLTIAVDLVSAGTTDPAIGIHGYVENSIVTISATPELGYELVGWTGDCTLVGEDCQVTMDADKSVTANFALIEYPLNISVVGSGSVSKNPDQATYHYGDSVELTAVEDSGWVFFGWGDDLSGSENPETLVMDGEKTITATFVEGGIGEVLVDGAVSHGIANEVSSMSFAHTTGSGNDRFMLVGISWNSGESAKNIASVVFNYGSTELTFSEVITEEVMVSGSVTGPRYAAIYRSDAEPPAGTAGTIEVNFDAEITNGIVAGAVNFEGVNQATPLGTPVGENGGTSSDPALNLTGLTGVEMVFDTVFLGGSDDSYELSVGADQMEHWNDFSENARGTASTEQAAGGSVTMSWTPSSQNWWAAAAVPINPAAIGPTHELTMAISPASSGSTTPIEGVHTYPEDTVVDISASPATGYVFDSWSGDVAAPSSADTTVTMDADKTVTANFVPEEYTLTINTVGDGSVTKDPDQATYQYGDSVELTANPASGWLFAGWSGDLGGMVNPDSITISGDMTVTATFIEDVPGNIVYLGDVGSGTIKEESASLTVTTDADVAAGDAIIISYAIGPHPDLQVTVSDSVGNTYEQIELARSYENGRTYIFAAFNVTALPAGSEITLTSDIGSGGEFPYPSAKAAIVSVFRGLADIEVADQTLGNPTFESETAITGTDPSVGPTGTTVQDKELVVAAIGTNGPAGDAAGTWQYDFITGQRVGTTGGDAQDNWTVSMGYKFVDTTGAFTAQKTGVTDRYYAAVIATFKAESEVNQAPVVSISDQSIPEGGSFLTIDLDSCVDDPDNLDEELTWRYEGNSELTVSIDEYRVATIGIPGPDWFGTEYITFTAEDPGGETGSDEAEFEVSSVNDLPEVSDIGDQTIDEGESFITINLDDYVSDVEDDDADITWAATGQTDLIVSIDDRVATITAPSLDWFGSETITFTATDTDLGSDSDDATFTVNAINDPPVVSDIPDQTVSEGGTFDPIYLDDFVSDVDNTDEEMTWSYEGDSHLQVSIVDRVATITILDPHWNGSETITFTAKDPDLASDSDPVIFTVSAVVEPPEVTDIPDQTIEEGESFTTITLDDFVSDPDHDDDELVWTYSNNSDLDVDIDENRIATITTPDDDWSGAEMITFTATDPDNASDSDSATFTVNDVNDPPVVDDIPDQMIAEGGSFVSIDLDDHVSDVDNTDAEISWEASGQSELSVNIIGRVATIGIPGINWNGAETITFTAEDPAGASDDDSATFTVTAVNDPPVLTYIADKAVDETDELTFTALATDVDEPSQDLTFYLDDGSAGSVPAGAGISTGGEFSWTPTEEQGPDSYTFDVCVTDGALSDCETIIVTVNEVNLAPSLDPIGNKAIDEGSELTFTATGSDSDLPEQTLTFSLEDGAAGQVPDGASITDGGSFSWTPAEEQGPGVHTFDVCVSDGDASDCETIEVTVSEVNVLPSLDSIGNKSVDEGSPLTFLVTASDPDIPEQDLVFNLSNSAQGDVPIGASISADGHFEWTPLESQGPDTYSFNVCVSDGSSQSICETISVDVFEVNEPPVLDPIGNKLVMETEELVFTATASDGDIPTQDLLFSLVGAPSGASIDPDTGEFSWTPTSEQVPDTYTFDVCVSDGVVSICETIDVEATEYVPKSCYSLTIAHSGYGTDPIADPPNSEGCPAGQYEPGVSISLLDATPDKGWHIAAWEGTEDDGSKGEDNLIIMPDGDADVMVKYETFVFVPLVTGGK